MVKCCELGSPSVFHIVSATVPWQLQGSFGEVKQVLDETNRGYSWDIQQTYTNGNINGILLGYIIIYIYIWLVVSTPLKNISQLGSLFPIYGKIKHVPNHQSDIYIYNYNHGISNLGLPENGLYPEMATEPLGK